MNRILLRMSRIIGLSFLCASMLLFTGCWDQMELNDLALITAAAIDKKGESVELTVQVFTPKPPEGGGMSGGSQGGGSSGGQTFVRSAVGVSIADAMSKLQEKLPRFIFWGQSDLFIIGSDLARKGIRSHIDFLVRHPQVRENILVFISDKKAKRALELFPPLERSSSEVLRELTKSGIGMKVTLSDIVQTLRGDTGAVALPWIEELPPQSKQDDVKTIPYITGTAVFKKDKLVGHIDKHTTRGVLWLRNDIRFSTVTVSPKEAPGSISTRLLRVHSRLIPKIENGRWMITLKAETEHNVVQNGTNLDMMNPKFVKMIEKDLENDIRRRAQKAVKQVQYEHKADIFGFADAFHRKYPKEWNELKIPWEEKFPEVEVKYDIKALIRRPGKSTVPAGMRENEVRQK